LSFYYSLLKNGHINLTLIHFGWYVITQTLVGHAIQGLAVERGEKKELKHYKVCWLFCFIFVL